MRARCTEGSATHDEEPNFGTNPKDRDCNNFPWVTGVLLHRQGACGQHIFAGGECERHCGKAQVTHSLTCGFMDLRCGHTFSIEGLILEELPLSTLQGTQVQVGVEKE